MNLVRVREIHLLPGAGNLKGFATVEVGPWTIHGCRIIQQPGQPPYVALPQHKSANGRFFPLLQTSDIDLKRAIAAAVLSELDSRESYASIKQSTY